MKVFVEVFMYNYYLYYFSISFFLNLLIFPTIAEVEYGENESEDDVSSSTSGNSLRSYVSMPSGISELEKGWRASAYDYEYRYCGHCNTTTDIKEANFLGRLVLSFEFHILYKF